MPMDLRFKIQSNCGTAVLRELDFLLSALGQLSNNKNSYRRDIFLHLKGLLNLRKHLHQIVMNSQGKKKGPEKSYTGNSLNRA